jgi:hypothetical protein
MLHYIYHIPSKNKIGVTTNVQKRMAQHNILETEYMILEIATSAKVASTLERKWQEYYGYPIDNIPYHKTLHNITLRRYNQKLRQKKMGL